MLQNQHKSQKLKSSRRRGGASSRDGRGNSSQHSIKPKAGPPSFQGRGHGGRMSRGGGRGHNQPASGAQSAHSASAKEPHSNQASAAVPVAVSLPRLPVAWCDICRVDCNSLETLEQHNNGKRHKKTVKRYEEMQARQKLLAEMGAQDRVGKVEQAGGHPETMTGSLCDAIKQPEMALVPKTTIESQSDAILQPLVASQPRTTIGSLHEEHPEIACSHSNTITESLLDANEQTEKAHGMIKSLSDATEKPKLLYDHPEGTTESLLASEMTILADEQGIKGDEDDSQCASLKEKSESELQIQNIDQQHEDGNSVPDFIELPSEAPARSSRDGSDKIRPFKRKTSKSRAGVKRPRYFDRPKEKQPKERRRMCSLCNIICDTEAVFEIHLAGKKHISKAKRFHGQAPFYGPGGSSIPPNQPSANAPQAPYPIHHGHEAPPVMERAAYGHHGYATEAYQHYQAGYYQQGISDRRVEEAAVSQGQVPKIDGQQVPWNL